ncbi:hypothetical protein CSAL01_13630 [Colletotrichum salicis]|uniref:Uncharacterized protein n=1 Tax=Colletotrichum salicis TaxID=1209931 RepID=A0A135V8F0_9PEZI|nr:hypothetical protein CSAL01_13630 [Colletotrichum salicis]
MADNQPDAKTPPTSLGGQTGIFLLLSTNKAKHTNAIADALTNTNVNTLTTAAAAAAATPTIIKFRPAPHNIHHLNHHKRNINTNTITLRLTTPPLTNIYPGRDTHLNTRRRRPHPLTNTILHPPAPAARDTRNHAPPQPHTNPDTDTNTNTNTKRQRQQRQRRHRVAQPSRDLGRQQREADAGAAHRAGLRGWGVDLWVGDWDAVPQGSVAVPQEAEFCAD